MYCDYAVLPTPPVYRRAGEVGNAVLLPYYYQTCPPWPWAVGQGGALKCAPVVPKDPLGRPRHPRHRKGRLGGLVKF